MALATITKLLKENESELLRERRSADRRPFVRPISVRERRDSTQECHGFSRDISPVGLGMIGQQEWRPGFVGIMTIHSLGKHPAEVVAELRWCQPYGEGWFQSGWRFLREGT